MRFLADESCNFAVIQALRSAGHDVLAISEISPRVEDPAVIGLVVRDERILLTEDKDFGQLVYAHSQNTLGVLFLRYPAAARRRLSHDVVTLIEQRGEGLAGRFVVVQPGRIRIGRTPGR